MTTNGDANNLENMTDHAQDITTAHDFENSTNPNQGREISLRRTATQLYGAASGGYDGCCPPVVDPYTLLALLVGIALATYFLNVLINVTMVSW